MAFNYDFREIRWDGNNGFIFVNPFNIPLHSVLPHPISLVDSSVSFDLIIPSFEELVYAMPNYQDIRTNGAVNLVCLIGFDTPIIELTFYYVNQNDIRMRIMVIGNDGGSYIDLNIGYDETHHFEIILRDYTAEIIMDDETLEFTDNLDEPISRVPVSNEQPYVFIGTWYFSYFMYTLSGIHIETDTVLANSEYDINYWLGEFETAYSEE
ncbi:hypothetical protein [Methanosphaera sp.]|uniref:hypothetical protein n=1 Tax=Methanosphaera sp. TaxID=2666342 RepID=UPI0025F5BA56|nr:hypothetical protein [Methanosphaera sp.]